MNARVRIQSGTVSFLRDLDPKRDYQVGFVGANTAGVREHFFKLEAHPILLPMLYSKILLSNSTLEMLPGRSRRVFRAFLFFWGGGRQKIVKLRLDDLPGPGSPTGTPAPSNINLPSAPDGDGGAADRLGPLLHLVLCD